MVAGLTQGMTTAELKLMHTFQEYNMYASDLKLKPDVLAGHKGEQIAVYVLNNRDTFLDTKNADGRNQHLMSLTKNKVRCLPIALDSIVSYDLQNFKLQLRDDFSFESLLRSPNATKDWLQGFTTFSFNLTQNTDGSKLTGNMDAFVDALVAFYQLKSRADLVHEPAQVINANDELKVELMRLKMKHDLQLTNFEKEQVKQAILQGKQYNSFNDMVHQMRVHLVGEGKRLQG